MDEDQDKLYKLFCLIENNSTAFSIMIVANETVDDLKKRIKNENPNTLNYVDAKDLELWKVDTPDDRKIDSSGLNDENALKPTRKISNYWNEKTLPENCIHVYIRIRGK